MAFVPLWHPDDVQAVIIDIAVIATWSALVGYVFHRMPARWFGHDNLVTRPRRWERDGRVWDVVFRVRRWKDRVPDAGALFAGGMRKRGVTRDPEQLERFVLETVSDLVEEFGADPEVLRRTYILRDCTSPVRHPTIDFARVVREQFERFARQGVRFIESTDPLPF